MTTLIITFAVFIGVSALVGSVAFILRGETDQKAEDRLAMLTSASSSIKKLGKDGKGNSAVLAGALDEHTSFADGLLEKFNLQLYYEQAHMPIPPRQFLIILGITAAAGSVLPSVAGLNPVFGVISGLTVGLFPLLWLSFKRKFRLKGFAKQLPDALELIARALRAGHSLAAGFSLVADEMTDPIGGEFQKVFEEQNLGIPMEEALNNMCARMPNLDLKFFATAVILQRQTGGDLAEILDKIGYIIRERFKIWGQVQALQGEGRLSGVVLLALPPVLFVAVYRLNPDYVMPLFYDPMGRKMLFFGVVMQLLGALAIRKIVNIKVQLPDHLAALACDALFETMTTLFAATPMEMLVPVAVFVAVAALAWWLVDFFSASSPRAEERLDELKNPTIRRRGDDLIGSKKNSNKNQMSKVLAKAAPALAKPLQPKTGEEQGKLKARLVQAGFRHESHPSIFLGLKFAGLVFGLVVGGGILFFTTGVSQGSLMKSGCIAGFFFYLPDMVVWIVGKGRKDAIFLGLPDALDLMVVCVEAGLGLDQAMRKVADEMKRSCRVVSEEFSLCNFQLQMGRPRNDVLHELGARSGVDDLRSLAAILIQADKFGSSIAQALRVQSDAMRTRRRQLAEEKAAKTAVKLIFPLVIFIFPAIFVVLVGPAAITMVNEMFPVMAGQQ